MAAAAPTLPSSTPQHVCSSHLRQGAVAEAEEVDIPLVQRVVVLELEGKPKLLGVGAHEP